MAGIKKQAKEAQKSAAEQLKKINPHSTLGESPTSEAKHADAAEKKAEHAAHKAMHAISKMEKDVDTKDKLNKDVAGIKKQAKEAQKSAAEQLKKINPHSALGESPGLSVK